MSTAEVKFGVSDIETNMIANIRVQARNRKIMEVPNFAESLERKNKLGKSECRSRSEVARVMKRKVGMFVATRRE